MNYLVLQMKSVSMFVIISGSLLTCASTSSSCQFTAAVLDQYPEEPAVHLRCADLRPRGCCAVRHCADIYGFLHHRRPQTGTGELITLRHCLYYRRALLYTTVALLLNKFYFVVYYFQNTTR